MTRRTTASLVAVTMAGAALVTPVAGSAAPTTIATSYLCAMPIMGNRAVSMTLTMDPPATAYAGDRVPARAVSGTVMLDETTVATLRANGVGALGGELRNALYRVGDKAVPLTLNLPAGPLPASGPFVLSGTGTAARFRAGLPGSYAIRVPATVEIVTTQPDGPSSSFPCTLGLGVKDRISDLGVLAKATSTTRARVLRKPVTSSERARIRVRVTSAGLPGAGRVVALLRGRKLDAGRLVNGKVTLRLPALAAGTRTVKVRYKGATGVAPSSKRLTFLVRED